MATLARRLAEYTDSVRFDDLAPETVHEVKRRVLDSLQHGHWAGLAELEPPLVEKARPEAALRHLEVLRGFLLEDLRGRVLEHESSPGLGTALVEFPLDSGASG